LSGIAERVRIVEVGARDGSVCNIPISAIEFLTVSF
jgi:hypothetical protein